MRTRLALPLLLVSALLVWPDIAQAYVGTAVPASINSSTTWTKAGSPYIVSGITTVGSGAVLTINAGVVVKFAPSARLWVNGTISASGAQGENVIFTSVRDDAADGVDSDPSTSVAPAPGDWANVQFQGASSNTSVLSNVIVRYGGGGGVNHTSGSVSITGSFVFLTDSRVTQSLYSGITMSGGTSGTAGGLSLTGSRLDHNGLKADGTGRQGDGIYVNSALVYATYSRMDHNGYDGVSYGMVSSYVATQPTFDHVQISNNYHYAVEINAQSGLPDSLFPVGAHSNLLNNGQADTSLGGVQLSTPNRPNVSWQNNYWGTWGDNHAPVEQFDCSAFAPSSAYPKHLLYGTAAYYGSSASIPPGPVASDLQGGVMGGHATYCRTDHVKTVPYSTKPFKVKVFDWSTVSPAQELANAVMYRPFLRFDSSEHWRPLNLDYLLYEQGADTLPAHVWHGCHCLGAEPTDAVSNLGQLVNDDSQVLSGGYLDIWQTGGGSGDRRSPYTLTGGPCEDAFLFDCSADPYTAIYYNRTVVQGADGDNVDYARSYWDYWTYYRNNDYSGPLGSFDTSFDHEGDWEGMTVVTTAEPLAPQVEWVGYAQHEGAAYRYLASSLLAISNPEDATSSLNGLHAVGYVADGDHATYPDFCSSGCNQSAYLPGGVFNRPETDHDGRANWSGNSSCVACVLSLPENSTDALALPDDPESGRNATSWNASAIHWGDSTDSPQAPGQQPRYLQPWLWQPGPAVGARTANGAGGQLSAALALRTDESECAGWFGPGVATEWCDPTSMQAGLANGRFGLMSGDVVIHVSDASKHRSGQTTGLVQVIGAALRNGSVVNLNRHSISHGELRVRLTSAGRTYLARFMVGYGSGVDHFELRVDRTGGQLSVSMVANSQTIPARRVVRVVDKRA
jgi:hypothetical protein